MPLLSNSARRKRANGLFRIPVTMTIAAFVMMAGPAAAAHAVAPAAGWAIDSSAAPTDFSAGDNAFCEANLTGAEEFPCDTYVVTARNAGAASTRIVDSVTLTDTVPPGLTVRRVQFRWSGFPQEDGGPAVDLAGLGWCHTSAPEPAGTTVKCELPLEAVQEFGLPPLAPDDRLQMTISTTVDDPSASGTLTNSATISGGGAPSVSTQPATSPSNEVGQPPPGFGPSSFDFAIDGLSGSPDTQAGDHPYELTTTIALNSDFRPDPESGQRSATSVQDAKDIVVNLPVGFVGSTLAAPRCTFAQLSSRSEGGVGGCPKDTVVGHILTEPGGPAAVNSDIYNMVPENGVPAEFAFVDGLANAHVLYVRVVPTARGYVLQTTNPDIPQIRLAHIVVSFYGDPAARDQSGNAQIPLFTNPTGCESGPQTATIYMDSWQNPGSYNPDGTPNFSDPAWVSGEHARSTSPAVTGCNALQFTPEVALQPTTHMADTPSGAEFEIKLFQSEETGTLATPVLKRAVVKLPEGFTVDPSAGDGLGACSLAQIGWTGPSATNFTPSEPQCPENSKIGTLELSTPLLPDKLTGALYLARQDENPFNALLAGYIVVDDPVTGVLVKIAGEFHADPVTGRLTAMFDENPQLPFSDLKLHFFGGPRAELATPEGCGTFTTNTEFSPWSLEGSELPATPFDSFVINEACPGGFSPSFAAGSTNLQAGAYTPFVVSFGRSDTDQELQNLSVTLPPGLLADVGSVPLCGEAQANAGTCPEASQVGTVQTGVGPGPDPLFVAGKVYLTGPYNGGPYGLSVVVPAVAGPFDFGTVVVRQSIRIDPTTAQVTDVSDPFPTIIDGIPLRLRRVDVTLNRPGFTFNPTNCAKLAFTGTIDGSPLGAPRRLNGTVGYATQPGASSPFTTPFQVTNCTGLKFQPKFTVSTSGKTSKAMGASLAVKLTYPSTPQGTEANITRVKVDLPKQLPSRLTTLQKACTAAQFNTNPAGCPKESVIGHARAITPILPVPLEGPAYFVSHGGEAFPSLIMVLQGDNVTLDLVGTTFISKAGITSSTFQTVPDAPVGSFELTLPQGRFSALAANGNLCKSKLAMPTEFLAQNGAKINESTSVSVTGCAKAKALTRAQKLAAALKACKKKAKSKRAACNAIARKRYGSLAKKKAKVKRKG
jgi:hypothetical protein